MSHSSITIIRADWRLYEKTLKSVRVEVFVDEQGIPTDIENDRMDFDAFHFLVRDGQHAIGCGRLHKNGKVSRMAILEEYRRENIGSQLVEFIHDYAKENSILELNLTAQTTAKHFYQRAGYEIDGELFKVAGVEHIPMRLSLSDNNPNEFRPALRYPQPYGELALHLANKANRYLRIYSPQLDHDVFDIAAFADAISSLSRRSRHSDIKILINDSSTIIKRGHRLLDLSRRLSSFIKIQKISSHPEVTADTFMVKDLDGVIYSPAQPDRLGFYEPASRASSQKFIDKFDLLWSKSQPDPELRQLRL